MHVNFSESEESFIKSEVQNGSYPNESELVRDAVRRLQEQKKRIEHFKNAIKKGAKEIEEGRTSVLTPALMQEIVRSGIERAQSGKSYFSTEAIPQEDAKD